MSIKNNLDEVEIKLLLAVEKSGDNGCPLPLLIQTVGLSETKIKYYLDKLSDEEHELINWIGSLIPNVPVRYTLTSKGRAFLVEGNYI
ncbi:MAG: hypothetical protein JW870_16230 [Candidatus Delongbacteria bacterium]|nr:hypothetical protein [Candidatus Delongbacteria bacterium]